MEVVQLTLDFYRRNYIEGLFLSPGIIRNPDYTMEQVVKVARTEMIGLLMRRLLPLFALFSPYPRSRSSAPRDLLSKQLCYGEA